MAYVQPNSTIEFFSDINLSMNYENSLYFATTSAKDSYFSSLTKLATVANCSYTRNTRGYIRVELPMSRMINATYMRFKNTSFENKWFYAFVNKVDYVNNLTTSVSFTIDPLMTWMGDFHLNECYIERQHTLNDGIGNNIAEEGLSVGEYVIEGQERITLGSRVIAVIYLDPSQTQVTSQWLGGTYSGLHVAYATSPSQMDSILNSLLAQNLIDNVITIQMIPSKLANATEGIGNENITITKPYSSLNGYVPRNKKLFCYPYKFMRMDNSEGSEAEYMYEYFNTLPDATSSGDCNFNLFYCFNGRGEISIAPENYKGLSTTPVYNERLGMENFPVCAWGSNSYIGYLAQKNAYLTQDVAKANLNGIINGAMAGFGLGQLANATTPQAVQTPVDLGSTGSFNPATALPGPVGASTVTAMAGGGAAGLATLGASVMGSAFLGGIASMAKVIGNNLIENKVRPISPSVPHGSPTVDSMWAQGEKCFRVNKMCITKNYAMMLDSYFDMFGYAVKQHGVPNMNARPNWTYVKTIGCSVGGDLPADDATAIETIFDKGIRFWKNHNNIGNYSLNNAPA